jgi:hypothetical protein
VLLDGVQVVGGDFFDQGVNLLQIFLLNCRRTLAHDLG